MYSEAAGELTVLRMMVMKRTTMTALTAESGTFVQPARFDAVASRTHQSRLESFVRSAPAKMLVESPTRPASTDHKPLAWLHRYDDTLRVGGRETESATNWKKGWTEILKPEKVEAGEMERKRNL